MGAVNSVREIYREAIRWFHMYIDKGVYIACFEQLDEDGDGGISFQELQRWVNQNAEEFPNSVFSTLVNTGLVTMLAHKCAARHMDTSSSVCSKNLVDISEFRSLLIQLYALSIIYRHFCSTGLWEGELGVNAEIFSSKLDARLFGMAARSLCLAHIGEELTDKQIEEDFVKLDLNFTGRIGFVQIGMFCSKYIDTPLESTNTNQVIAQKNQAVKRKAGRVLGLNDRVIDGSDVEGEGDAMIGTSTKIGTGVSDVMGNMKKEKAIFAGITPKEKMQIAMEQLRTKIGREDFSISGFHAKRRMDEAISGVVPVK